MKKYPLLKHRRTRLRHLGEEQKKMLFFLVDYPLCHFITIYVVDEMPGIILMSILIP